MYLKFSRDEISWIDPIYLSKEVAQDLASFWLNTDNHKLYCARYMEEVPGQDRKIGHYFFDEDKKEWTLDAVCK